MKPRAAAGPLFGRCRAAQRCRRRLWCGRSVAAGEVTVGRPPNVPRDEPLTGCGLRGVPSLACTQWATSGQWTAGCAPSSSVVIPSLPLTSVRPQRHNRRGAIGHGEGHGGFGLGGSNFAAGEGGARLACLALEPPWELALVAASPLETTGTHLRCLRPDAAEARIPGRRWAS